jgi:ABC-2 type transport system permease protein
LLIVPLIAMVPVVQDPNGTLARILTYIPPFTAFLMMNRAGGPPPAWEYVATSILLVVSIAVAFWAAAKVFRIGILMTGKPPKIREILGWLRAPVGTVHVKSDDHTDGDGVLVGR